VPDPVHVGSGKVRELYEVGDDQLLLVASDRISAYDVILPQDIPDKGKVLTGLSRYWFEVTEDICPNHLISVRADDLPDVVRPGTSENDSHPRSSSPVSPPPP
jgi:phosphoribosylaminoimidazole-succinocarboxamide synthase